MRNARKLTFRHIEAIRGVMQTGSVTGAAARLFVTQPAISHLIRDVEDILEFTLFDRRFGRLVPTTRADLLFQEIERSFVSLDAINDFSAQLRDGEGRIITFAAVPVMSIGLLPHVIKTYRSNIAEDFFRVQSGPSKAVISMISTQKADLGFALALPPIPGVESEILAVFPALCLLPHGHRLMTSDVVSASDLAGEAMIQPSPGEGILTAASEAFDRSNGQPIAVVECPAATAACAMVEAGLGFTLLDPVAAYPFRNGSIVFKPFDPPIMFEFRAYWLASRHCAFDRVKVLEIARQRLAAIAAGFPTRPA